ncbi:MAG: sensor histidine kinase [Lachnospiraceae bacterium]
MERIRDKILLFIGGLFFTYFNQADIPALCAMLGCIVLISLQEYIKSDKICIGLAGVYGLLSIVFPVFAVYMPVILYELFFRRQWVFASFLAGISIFAFHRQGALPLSILVFMLLLSFLFAWWTARHLALVQEYKKQIDAARELELLLQDKNKNLNDRQDYEIHVATLKERNRIAREIHDNVGHLLTRSILQMGAVQAICTQENLGQPLQALSDTLNMGMDSIRKSVHDLRDDSLELQIAVRQFLKDYSQYTIDFRYELSEQLENPIKYCFLGVIREALSNVVKHSNADRIDIYLKEFSGFYQLLFRDNGTLSAAPSEDGMGLDNIRERVKALHGTVLIQQDEGFKIFISIQKKPQGGSITDESSNH